MRSSDDDDDFIFELLLQIEASWANGDSVDIRQACQERPHLEAVIQQRLAALQKLDAFLQTTASRGDSKSISTSEGPTSTTTVPKIARRMETTSEYDILRRHAQGGLGEVLVAHDRQLDRNVALKIIQAPYDRDRVRRSRFMREAEITSRLEHPGIVPVHGFGQDDKGRPCYTMRFIEGENFQQAIDRFHQKVNEFTQDQIRREQRNLLERFISVCNTIAFAHSRGVIHRDIKPSNVVLGKYRETLVVDWGLAKEISSDHDVTGETITEQPVVDLTRGASSFDPSDTKRPESHVPLTEHGRVLGTPAYMSPEQARGELRLTSASDIFSLGVMLATILHGTPSTNPSRPPPQFISSKSGNAKRSRPLVPHALHAIYGKAMQPEPTQRYLSALDLAADVERWLADEPVSVYRDAWSERLLRWTRRNKASVVAFAWTALIVLATLTIFAFQTLHWNEELSKANKASNQARLTALEESRRASRQAEIADQQSKLAVSVLQQVIQDIQRELIRSPATQTVRRSILEKSMAGLNQVAASVETRDQIDRNMLLARVYLADAFANIGNEADLAGLDAARKQLDRAREIGQQLVATYPDDLSHQSNLALVLNRLGTVESQTGTAAEAVKFWQECLKLRQTISERDSPNLENKLNLLSAYNTLGDHFVRGRSLEDAAKYYNPALELVQQLLDSQSSSLTEERLIEVTFNNVADLRLRQGRTEPAIALLLQSLARNRKRVELRVDDLSVRRDLSYVLTMLGRAYSEAGNLSQAEPALQEALELREAEYRQEPTYLRGMRQYAFGLERMGGLQLKLNKIDEAEKSFRGMQSMCKAILDLDPTNRDSLRNLSIAHYHLASVLWEKGEQKESIAAFEKSLQIDREQMEMDKTDPRIRMDVADSLTGLSSRLSQMERTTESLSLCDEAILIYRALRDSNPTDIQLARRLIEALRIRGSALRLLKDFDNSYATLEEAVSLYRDIIPDQSTTPARIDLAGILFEQGMLNVDRNEHSKALQRFEEALGLIQQLEQDGLLADSDLKWREKVSSQIQKAKERVPQ